jgi:hypothetical protein
MATLSPFWDSEWRLYRHFAMDSDMSPPTLYSQTALAAQVWITESKGETLDGALGKPFTSEMSTLPAARDPMGERAVPLGHKMCRLRYNIRRI